MGSSREDPDYHDYEKNSDNEQPSRPRTHRSKKGHSKDRRKPSHSHSSSHDRHNRHDRHSSAHSDRSSRQRHRSPSPEDDYYRRDSSQDRRRSLSPDDRRRKDKYERAEKKERSEKRRSRRHSPDSKRSHRRHDESREERRQRKEEKRARQERERVRDKEDPKESDSHDQGVQEDVKEKSRSPSPTKNNEPISPTRNKVDEELSLLQEVARKEQADQENIEAESPPAVSTSSLPLPIDDEELNPRVEAPRPSSPPQPTPTPRSKPLPELPSKPLPPTPTPKSNKPLPSWRVPFASNPAAPPTEPVASENDDNFPTPVKEDVAFQSPKEKVAVLSQNGGSAFSKVQSSSVEELHPVQPPKPRIEEDSQQSKWASDAIDFNMWDDVEEEDTQEWQQNGPASSVDELRRLARKQHKKETSLFAALTRQGNPQFSTANLGTFDDWANMEDNFSIASGPISRLWESLQGPDDFWAADPPLPPAVDSPSTLQRQPFTPSGRGTSGSSRHGVLPFAAGPDRSMDIRRHLARKQTNNRDANPSPFSPEGDATPWDSVSQADASPVAPRRNTQAQAPLQSKTKSSQQSEAHHPPRKQKVWRKVGTTPASTTKQKQKNDIANRQAELKKKAQDALKRSSRKTTDRNQGDTKAAKKEKELPRYMRSTQASRAALHDTPPEDQDDSLPEEQHDVELDESQTELNQENLKISETSPLPPPVTTPVHSPPSSPQARAKKYADYLLEDDRSRFDDLMARFKGGRMVSKYTKRSRGKRHDRHLALLPAPGVVAWGKSQCEAMAGRNRRIASVLGVNSEPKLATEEDVRGLAFSITVGFPPSGVVGKPVTLSGQVDEVYFVALNVSDKKTWIESLQLLSSKCVDELEES